jgi:general stress protein CsbA
MMRNLDFTFIIIIMLVLVIITIVSIVLKLEFFHTFIIIAIGAVSLFIGWNVFCCFCLLSLIWVVSYVHGTMLM